MLGIARCGLVCLTTLMLAAGCPGRRRTDYSQLELVDVRGTITLDDQPLGKVRVIFEAEDKTFSLAMTDSSGRYRLMYNSEQPGVKPGRKTVRITSTPSDEETDVAGLEPAVPGSAMPAELLPARYNTRSELIVEIGSETRTFDFKLLSSP